MATIAAADDLFPGFKSHHIRTDETTIFARTAGTGPPVILLHGFPQTHAMWHKIAPALTATHTVVLMDLRGYGSSAPVESSTNGSAYTKRAMAADVLAVMAHLGFGSTKFSIVGHDRGARLAYRLALDHPSRVERVSLMDIVPTATMFAQLGRIDVAMRAWHWLLFAQPAPFPETMVANSLDQYLGVFFGSGKLDAGGKQKAFHPTAVASYAASMQDPGSLHAMMEDYRAGARADRENDLEDLAAGKKIDAPVQLLWGDVGVVAAGKFEVLEDWGQYASNIVDAQAIASGHFIPEENPGATIEALKGFLG